MNKAVVGIVMGSDSDLPVMSQVAKMLDEFSVFYELRVLSAHRSPELVRRYALGATSRGLKIIIAGAGAAAHLAGVIAANTILPVIGVPIESKHLRGLDSLLSTVQMPKGIPVATVAINNAANAAILAVQFLALADHRLARRLILHKKTLRLSTIKADRSLLKNIRARR